MDSDRELDRNKTDRSIHLRTSPRWDTNDALSHRRTKIVIFGVNASKKDSRLMQRRWIEYGAFKLSTVSKRRKNGSIGRNRRISTCIQRWVPQLHPSTGAGGNRKKHPRSYSWSWYALRVLREHSWLLWKGACSRKPSPVAWASSTRSAIIWIPKASNVFETQRTAFPDTLRTYRRLIFWICGIRGCWEKVRVRGRGQTGFQATRATQALTQQQQQRADRQRPSSTV